MDDDEKAFADRNDLTWLEGRLADVDKQLQIIADRYANGAMLVYPHAYSNADLERSRRTLLARSEEILKKMEELHKALANAQTRPPT